MDEQGGRRLCLLRGGRLRDLSTASNSSIRSLDALLRLSLVEIRAALDSPSLEDLPELDLATATLLAPCESQEVWAAGVTYRRSRDARIEESRVSDVYADVYGDPRPELFFKANGWRVVGPGGYVGIRSDSSWNVPEPELALLCNASGEVVAYGCGNDMSSREIEGRNPLYLPQAKVYDGSCAIGPAAVLSWETQGPMSIEMTIRRAGSDVFRGAASTSQLVRDPAALAGVLVATYSLPTGAWLLTGTAIVPPDDFTLLDGDEIAIRIGDLGTLVNRVRVVQHSGASAEPQI